MKILVTDGNNRASLAITRSLGKKGFKVYVGSSRVSSIASSSKYCVSSFKYPHPRKDHQGFIDQLILQIKQHDIDVIIPVSDVSTFLVAKHRALFEEYCKLPFPSEDSVKLAADKARITTLAQESNIPVPETIIINNATDLNDIIDFKEPNGVLWERDNVRFTASTNDQYWFDNSPLGDFTNTWIHNLFLVNRNVNFYSYCWLDVRRNMATR